MLVQENNRNECVNVTSEGDFEIDLSIFTYDDFETFAISVRNDGVSPDSISKYRSAIKAYYRDNKLAIPDRYNTDFAEVLSGICVSWMKHN